MRPYALPDGTVIDLDQVSCVGRIGPDDDCFYVHVGRTVSVGHRADAKPLRQVRADLLDAWTTAAPRVDYFNVTGDIRA